MIPRTIQMAKEVANILTSTQLENYGNIIVNGYQNSPTSVRPALKGWTNNYQGYYTQLQPNGYGVNPGDPTMFEYVVHSFTKETGGIRAFGGNGTWISGGTGYTPGTYPNVPLTGGSGSGAMATVVIQDISILTGPIITWTQTESGQGYGPGVYTAENPAATGTGAGYGATFETSSNLGPPFDLTVLTLSNPGTDYAVGDLLFFPGGSKDPFTLAGSSIDAYVRVDSVGYAGVVTSVTVTSPGTGYQVGDSLSATLPGTGTGFYAPVGEIDPDPTTGGEPRWAQAPRRFFQNQVAPFVPPNDNQKAIQYSYMYPVVDNPVAPPIDHL